MLTEKQLNLVIERLVRRITQGNSFILKKIGKQFKKIKEVDVNKLNELQQELKYGEDFNEITNKIKEITRLNTKDIESIFTSVAKINQQFAKKYYDYKNIEMIPLDENENLKRIVKGYSDEVIKEYNKVSEGVGYSLFNTTDILTFMPIAMAYQNAIDYAVLKRLNGDSIFSQEIEKQSKKLGKSGLKIHSMIDNRAYRLDNYIKLEMQQGIRDMTNQLQDEFGKEYEADGIEISVHDYPAPDHAFVQGHQFTNEEFEKFQNDMDATDINGVVFPADFEGYDRRSIGEYNCYHYVFHIIIGVDKPQYTHEDLSEIVKQNDNGFFYNGKHYTMYEGTQLQNRIKNEIQEQEDIKTIAHESGNQDLEMLSRKKIINLNSKYKEVSDVSGLPTEIDKLKMWGYKKLKKDDIITYTREEVKALQDYISPSSYSLNDNLRNNLPLTEDQKILVRNLDSALEKTPNYSGNIVRTMEMINPEEFVNKLEIGKEFSTNQYLSFSNKKGYHTNPNILMYVENSKKGKDLININTIGENEVLYERNFEFIIENIVKKDNKYYILMKEK